MSVPVVVEVITERKTDIAMGPALDQIKEFEEVIDLPTEMDLSLPIARRRDDVTFEAWRTAAPSGRPRFSLMTCSCTD